MVVSLDTKGVIFQEEREKNLGVEGLRNILYEGADHLWLQ